MSTDFIMGKRYPRGVTRRRNKKGGENLPFAYFDLGQVQLNNSKDEYKRKLAEFKKMANVS